MFKHIKHLICIMKNKSLHESWINSLPPEVKYERTISLQLQQYLGMKGLIKRLLEWPWQRPWALHWKELRTIFHHDNHVHIAIMMVTLAMRWHCVHDEWVGFNRTGFTMYIFDQGTQSMKKTVHLITSFSALSSWYGQIWVEIFWWDLIQSQC